MEDILEELETETRRTHKFHSRTTQPNLLAVRSTDAITSVSSPTFSQFQLNLPRPILEVETIQLLHANIPQCVTNIPDTALVFWYYRLNEYTGLVPNTENLFFVRLLPSFYKQEFIVNPTTYGINKTFNNYTELATELEKSCARDLGDTNLYITASLLYDFRYLAGDISLPYNASLNKFQFLGNNVKTRFAYKVWNSGAIYGLNDVVVYGDFTYKYIFASTSSGVNPTNTTYWVQVAAQVIALYSNTTPYPAGRLVSFNNALYKSLSATTGNNPTTSFWALQIEDVGVKCRYLSAGFDDPNIVLCQNNTYRLWNEFALFEATTVVEYKGLFYQALFQSKGVVPTNTTFWVLTSTPPVVIGLNTCSSGFDMINVADAPFPEGIPGQPFNPRPKRTLNSILGFTWNGQMTPSVLGAIVPAGAVNFIPTTETLLFNRLRPVPSYVSFALSVPPIAGPPTSTTTNTFTAEGYCNLVYSSIVSIYASVVYGATTDSKRNTSLLAMGSMDCSNLGVSFFSGFIDNPLLIEGNDIYDISLSLEDEYGEPYTLTNNAVVSIALRLTYKK